MASDRLPVNAEMSGNVPVGPAASRKCQNCLNFRHLELIRHRTIRLRREPKANGNGQISSSSKWPVLARPSLAGFARPLTDTDFAWTGYDVTVSMPNPFSLYNAEVTSPADWSAT